MSSKGSLYPSCPRENDSQYCLCIPTYQGISHDQITWSIWRSVHLIMLGQVSSEYVQFAHLRLYNPHDIMDLLQKSSIHYLLFEINISWQPHIIIWSISIHTQLCQVGTSSYDTVCTSREPPHLPSMGNKAQGTWICSWSSLSSTGGKSHPILASPPDKDPLSQPPRLTPSHTQLSISMFWGTRYLCITPRSTD